MGHRQPHRRTRFAAAAFGLGAALTVTFLLSGCAKPRPVRPVIANANRLPKALFEGDFLFLKTLVEVGSPGADHRELFPGRYLVDDDIVRFRIGRNLIEVVDQDPKFDPSRGIERNPVLAAFPARNVDVLRKLNSDGQETNEEYEADDRNTWQNTKLVVIDFAGDRQDEYRTATRATETDAITLDGDVLNVDVRRLLEDGTALKIRYSFLRYRPSSTYTAREYPEELQTRFGFFKTVLYGRDGFGRVTQSNRRELMNRVDAAKPFVFRFTPGFPAALKPAARRSARIWADALKDITGRDVLVDPVDSGGETLGDLRYNFIHYDDSPDATHQALGYAPFYANPRTGEIVKADIVLYGSTLLRAVHAERTYRRLLRDGAFDEPTEETRPQPSDYYLRELFLPQGGRESFRAPSLPTSETELMTLVRAEFTPERTTSQLRQEMTTHDAPHATMLHGGIYGYLAGAIQADEGITDEKLTEDFFEQLLGHENGHPLGLRHNFMASADDRHYLAHGHTSSRMDYVWQSTQEPTGIGPYDRAALTVLYANGKRRTDVEQSSDVYLFCTDDRPDTLFNARNPLCLPYDAGATLSEAVDHHERRYRASYVLNNARLNQVWFPPTDRDYLRRVVAYLLPLRLIYDHSNAVLAAYSTGDYGRLWYLLRQRVEADGRAGEVIRTVTVAVGTDVSAGAGRANLSYRTERRRLDMNRVEDAVRDAKEAKVKSFRALARLIVAPSTPARPDTNTEDARFYDLQRRGVLPDKALALLLVGSRMVDPLGDGKRTTPFATMRYDVDRVHTRIAWDLFADLISDQRSLYAPDSGAFQGRVLQQYDLALRELAARLLVDEIGATPEGVDAMQMLSIDRSPVDARSWRRKRELQAQIALLDSALVPAEQAAGQAVGNLLTTPANGTNGVPGVLANLSLVGPNGMSAAYTLLGLHASRTHAQNEWRDLDRATPAAARADERLLDSIDALRPDRVTLAKRMREADPGDENTRTTIQAQIQEKAIARNRIGVAFAAESNGDRFLRAPCDIPGLPFVPGTCLLFRDNINFSEIAWLAIGAQMEALDRQIDEARGRPAPASRIRELEGQRENFRGQREFLRLYIAGEVDFAQRLIRYYRRDPR